MPTQKETGEYIQTINPQGYINNREITNLPGHFLVKGSHDCLIVNKEKVSSRLGTSLVGAAKTKNYGHRSSFDWETSGNVTRSLRMNTSGELEFYYSGTWYLLASHTANAKANFCTWWDATEVLDSLLWVAETDYIWSWSGAVVSIASATATTLTLATGTWAANRFLTLGTRKVNINGTEFEYTGGEGTATLTGLTAVPTLVAGQVVYQVPQSNNPAKVDGLTLDLIMNFNNYVFYGDKTHQGIYITAGDDYTDFSYTTPLRKPNEGWEMTIDSTPTAFVSGGDGENDFYISGRKNSWYKVTMTLSLDNAAEDIRVKKIPTSTGQGAQSQASVINIKNGVAFLNFEPSIDTLARTISGDTQSLPISWEIKDDILSYDLTDAHGIFYQNQMFIALPLEGVLLIYDDTEKHWQPPQYLSIGRLALIDINGDGTQVLCGHSSNTNETFRIFAPKTYKDNGKRFKAEAWFGYENFGTRMTQKNFDEACSELYMSENTVVKNVIRYDYKGASGIKEFDIRGDDETIQFKPNSGGGFGYSKFGNDPLGSLTTSIEDLSKIRVVDTMPLLDFYERQRGFVCDSEDMRFSILAFGENITISDNINSSIKH